MKQADGRIEGTITPGQSLILDRLRGGLVASCQPVEDGPMDRPEIVAATAQATVVGGAVGLRIEGVENLSAVRPLVEVPIIGIAKTNCDNSPVRITATTDDVAALIKSGAEIVAYDATDRPREHARDDVQKSLLAGGALAMADCSTMEDAREAFIGGASILGTALSGYTAGTAALDEAPDLRLIGDIKPFGAFVMAEGRYVSPELAAQAIQAGADSVTVGSALTRLELITGGSVGAVRGDANA